VTIHARFVGAGVQPLIDAVRAAGVDPGDLRAVVWQATWARGYDDVVAPAPAVRLKEDGFIIFARVVDAERYAAIIDTGHALWALVARGVFPTLGARVRITPAFVEGEIGWDVVILDRLGLGISIRFGARGEETNSWAGALRAAVQRIADSEVERRKAIVIERRTLVPLEPVKPFREEIAALQDQLRLRVESEAAARPAERTAFDRGNERQRKSIIDEVKARRMKIFQKESAALRARMPDLQAEYAQRQVSNAEILTSMAELEDAGSRSRGITERVDTIANQITAVEAGELLISCDPDKFAALGPSDFDEISNTVGLLNDLIPRRAQKR
jgi:hypothetical protein